MKVRYLSIKKISREQKNEIIKGNVATWLVKEWNKRYDIIFKIEENLTNIQIFINAYAEFLKDVNIKEPPNKNTMIDLFQLLYISQNDRTLIWTEEPKINKKIKKSFPENEWKNIIYEDNFSFKYVPV